MKNTWIQSAESRNMDNYMDDENDKLYHYYYTDSDKLENHIKEITQATIDEFWKPEAFNHDEDYCEHMMYFYQFLPEVIAGQTKNKVALLGYKEISLFKFVMLAILSDIEFYNNIYTALFYEGDLVIEGQPMGYKCKCKACQ